MNRPRLIPVLLIDDGNLIKTIQFKQPRYIGDPINAVKIFNEKEVDELSIIDRSAYKKGINFQLLSDIANEAFMPLSYGGGIKSVEDAIKVIRIGYEKIILNEITYSNLNLIKELSNKLGSQSVVVSIDYKKNYFKKTNCYYQQGKMNAKKDPLDHAINCTKYGAGEIIITSIDHEGKMLGYDLVLINNLSVNIEVPIILNGGAGTTQDFKLALESGASAVAASSRFIYFGPRNGILINFPSYSELTKEGIYNG